MFEGPNIANVAALIGDHARATMLTSLMAGEALTASELALEANITRQTASGHLAKLRDAGLVIVASQGRHRYFQLADEDVANLLEQLMGVAQRTGARRVRPGPKDPALRKARVCYDHLAGELGVELFDSLQARGFVKSSADPEDRHVDLTGSGHHFFVELGLPTDNSPSGRRSLCRSCLDWSVRRHHLSGLLGASILDYCFNERWAKRVAGTRVVEFTVRGEQQFREVLLAR